MKVFISILFAAGSLVAPLALPALAVASTDVALACPADAPEGWKRAGGYCEVRSTLNTIGTEKGTGGPGGVGECEEIGSLDIPDVDHLAERLLVAGEINPCCASLSALPAHTLPEGLFSRTDEYLLVGC